MQTFKLEDKVLIYLVQRYKDNSNSSNTSFSDVTKYFSEYKEEELIDAVNKIKTDGFLEIMYYNSKPGSIFVKISALRQIAESSFVSKGYSSLAEIMTIINPAKKRRKPIIWGPR